MHESRGLDRWCEQRSQRLGTANAVDNDESKGARLMCSGNLTGEVDLARHVCTARSVCSTSVRMGKQNTNRRPASARCSCVPCSRRHSQPSTAVAVFPEPVGASSRSARTGAVAKCALVRIGDGACRSLKEAFEMHDGPANVR